jgi:two-component system cell cycle response regulator DivK
VILGSKFQIQVDPSFPLLADINDQIIRQFAIGNDHIFIIIGNEHRRYRVFGIVVSENGMKFYIIPSQNHPSLQFDKMKKRVLILDDDPDILQICAIVLKKKGFDVSTLNSSGNILENVSNYQPDVVLMDNWIPGPGGVEATRMLKNKPELHNIPVIFFSANSNGSQLAAQAGADYFLQKPFDIAELETIVNQAIQHAVETGK